MPERITKQLVKLLEAMIVDPAREWYGLELMNATKLSSGTLYPLLHRLVQDGWLVRTSEEPSTSGGPTRRLYVLTGVGQRAATEVLAERDRPSPSRRPTGSFRPGLQAS